MEQQLVAPLAFSKVGKRVALMAVEKVDSLAPSTVDLKVEY